MLTVAVALGLTVIAGVGVGSATAKAAAGPVPTTSYYVALGDSLAAGYQPNSTPPIFGASGTQGYVNDVYKVYAKRIPGLALENLSCPGETSATMIQGGCIDLAQAPSGGYLDGSQLAQAEDFISHNHVAFITIDIGANDTIVPCETQIMQPNAPALDACTTAGIASDNSNLPTILSGLQAADTQGAPFFALNYPDPLVGLGAYGYSAFASASATDIESINQALASSYAAASVPVVDVWDAFSTGDTTSGGSLPYTPKVYGKTNTSANPVNLQAACALTWVCSSKTWTGTLQEFQGIHPNKTGYGVIAEAVETSIGWLPTKR